MAKILQLIGDRAVVDDVADAEDGAADQAGIDLLFDDRLAVELAAKVFDDSGGHVCAHRRGGGQPHGDATAQLVVRGVRLTVNRPETIEPPVSSIRWEMLREGIEDYEYLVLLRELIAKKRSSLAPEQVSQYEHGKRLPLPGAENFDRIAAAYEVSPEKLQRVIAEIKHAASTSKEIDAPR